MLMLIFAVVIACFCCAPLPVGLGRLLPWAEASVVVSPEVSVRFRSSNDPRWACGHAIIAEVFRRGRPSGDAWMSGGYLDCGEVSFGALLLRDGRIVVRMDSRFYVEDQGELVALSLLEPLEAEDVYVRVASEAPADGEEAELAILRVARTDERRACTLLREAITRAAAARPATRLETLRAEMCPHTP